MARAGFDVVLNEVANLEEFFTVDEKVILDRRLQELVAAQDFGGQCYRDALSEGLEWLVLLHIELVKRRYLGT